MSTRPARHNGQQHHFLRTWTPEEEAAVIACMERGMMPYAIARELGMGKDRVEHKVHQLRVRREDLQPPTHTTKRKCLRCQGTFPSEHVGNRMCRTCRQTVEGLPTAYIGTSA